MRRALNVMVAAMLAIPVLAQPASACSCALVQPLEAMGRSQAVFVGSFTGERQRVGLGGLHGEMSLYEFEVDEWVKGDLGSPVWVRSASNGAACGFETPPGARVAVYLSVQGSTPTGGLCSTGSAEELLAALRPIEVDGSGPAVATTVPPSTVPPVTIGAQPEPAAVPTTTPWWIPTAVVATLTVATVGWWARRRPR